MELCEVICRVSRIHSILRYLLSQVALAESIWRSRPKRGKSRLLCYTQTTSERLPIARFCLNWDRCNPLLRANNEWTASKREGKVACRLAARLRQAQSESRILPGHELYCKSALALPDWRRSVLDAVSSHWSLFPARLFRRLLWSACGPESVWSIDADKISIAIDALWWNWIQYRSFDFSVAGANLCQQDTAWNCACCMGSLLS